MFAVVRTGGKQYRVAPGDKIVVEKLAGDAGDAVKLDDVLLAGDGSKLEKTDGLIVDAKIIAQAKGEKVTVFKKKRRHNYRRKRGHRQQHTILEILSIGGKGAAKKAPAKKADDKKSDDKPAAKPAKKAAAPAKKSTKDAAPAKKAADKKPAAKKAPAKKPAAKKTEKK
ncbi:50S ribosomal protein L21 [Sphingomicrobium flavum]|uniref:50S ribosomal protein L21 n=1 Tax=Sphingomicrobium flavum TaxID=1229164 RepID=UPI0021ADA9BD|nr:50S ribosomal protein L21 [Sphingomicrobium flavum]